MDKIDCYLKHEPKYDFVIWNWDTDETKRKKNIKCILKYIQQYDSEACLTNNVIYTRLYSLNTIKLNKIKLYIVHMYNPNYETNEIFLCNTKTFKQIFYVR